MTEEKKICDLKVGDTVFIHDGCRERKATYKTSIQATVSEVMEHTIIVNGIRFSRSTGIKRGEKLTGNLHLRTKKCF